MMQWRSHRGRGEKGKVVMKGESHHKGGTKQKGKVFWRRGSSGEEEEVPKRRRFQRGGGSEGSEGGCEGCEGEEKRRGGMRTENSKHQNPTSPELEALQRSNRKL